MRVLVTGAAGFIGRYVTEELQRNGYVVTGLDNFSKYGEPPDVEYIPVMRGDAKNPSDIIRLGQGCAHIIAGAAMIGGIRYFHELPYDLLAENERIMAATCDAAIELHKHGTLRKVTYISSSMVYESTDTFPSAEHDTRRKPPPRSSYGFQKLAVEYWARAAWEQYRVPYTILRPFNCVGVGEGPLMSHVVPDLARKIIRGQDPVELLGNGSQIRCFTYGKDLANGIVRSLEHPNAQNEVFNLSSPYGTAIRDLAEMIWEMVRPGEEFRYILVPGYEHDVQMRVPDVRKARALLGFEAVTPLEDMVQVVVDHVRQEEAQAVRT